MFSSKLKSAASTLILLTILWFLFTGRINLFIHPRYNMFTAFCVGFGLLAAVSSFFLPAKDQHDETSHSAMHKLLGTVATAVTGLLVLAMVIVNPQPLSSSLASSRQVNGGVMSASQAKSVTPTGNYKAFQVKDWAVLTQSSAHFLYAGKPVKLSGYVVPIDSNHFYLTRLVVYCCTVDAQPFGVVVSAPSWRLMFDADSWVTVQGSFQKNHSVSGYEEQLQPSGRIVKITEPELPYEY